MKKTNGWKFMLFISACLWGVLLCGCSTGGNTLLINATPETSDLGWYTYVGTSGTFHVMSDASMEKAFLKELSEVKVKPATDFSHDKLTVPIYGLKISGTEGRQIEIAWSNGYCITADGSVYTFAYDFKKLTGDYEWTGIYPFSHKDLLPCIREMSLSGDDWMAWMLEQVEEPVPPEGISMVLTAQSKEELQIELTNGSAEEWTHGTHYSVQVLLDDVWYYVPEVPGIEGFNALAVIHPAGTTVTESVSLKRYGELPRGKYRLVKEGMVAEFEIRGEKE